MTIEEKIKYQYMKLLYEKLELKKTDDYFKTQRILPKKIVGNPELKISDYFFLFNKVNLSLLSNEELEKINRYFSIDIHELQNSDLVDEVNAFLLENINKILIGNPTKKYIGYGAINPNNVVPSDAITFVCHFLKYQNENPNSVSKIVFDKLNYMQDVLAKEKNIKIAVIPCDELQTIEFK